MKTGRISPAICIVLLGLAAPGFARAAEGGEKTFVSACSACHTAKKQPLDKLRLSQEGWNEAVSRMISYGAEIPKGKLPELLDYLDKKREPAGAASAIRK